MHNASFYQQKSSVNSFSLAYTNKDGILISYGPNNGRLWRGEEVAIQTFNLIDGLNNVFNNGFTPSKPRNNPRNPDDDTHSSDTYSPLADLPYIQTYKPHFIASNTYASGEEYIGFDNEQMSAGTCGYTYLLDTNLLDTRKENKIKCIPLCEENLLNQTFMAGYSGEMLTEGPDYAILTKPDPGLIIGAVPSAFVAFAFGIDEKSFIKNPAYKGIFRPHELTEISGFTLCTPENLTMQYPNLSISDVYQRYLLPSENETHPVASRFALT